MPSTFPSTICRRRTVLDRLGAALPPAVVYCEGDFGRIDGKTANGLVRHSERYRIVAVIDSVHAGADAGMVLGEPANGIPVVAGLDCVDVGSATNVPEWFVIGMAPSERSAVARGARRRAQRHGAGSECDERPARVPERRSGVRGGRRPRRVEIVDVRRPSDKKDLRMFSGRIESVTCPRIAVLGTDGAIGKRTTSTVLAQRSKQQGSAPCWSGPGRPA